MSADIVSLPWPTLLTLASGYAGYFVANVGVRLHHKTIDVTFSTLVFGFFAAFVFEWIERSGKFTILPASLLGFSCSILLGCIWRIWLRDLFYRALRGTNVSHSNDLPNAWMALFGENKTDTTQLSVKLKDGTWLLCSDLALFRAKPNGPCVLGGSGDVLMYVTHRKPPLQPEFEEYANLLDQTMGDEISYIPSDQIARVDVRRKARAKKLNPSSV